MDVFEAIRSRRTVKSFGSAPVARELLDELFELARWAPNHNLTNPWRFRVLGPVATGNLRELAAAAARAKAADQVDPEAVARVAAAKFDRAPVLVAVSAKCHRDVVQHKEDLYATACAAYIVLLGAHERGLAAYWRTPGVLRSAAGLAAIGMDDDEEVLGLIYLGYPAEGSAPSVPGRNSHDTFVSYLE